MAHVRVVRIAEPRSSVSAVPGESRVWEALCHDLLPLTCQWARIVFLSWPEAKDAPSDAELQSALSFAGFHEIALLTEQDKLCFQVRRLGAEPEALTTLLRETWGASAGFEVWTATQFEFENAEPIFAALQAHLSLGAHSGFFHPVAEEARVLSPGDSWSWPLPKLKAEHLSEAYLEADRKGHWSVLRKNYRLIESRPRQEAEIREIADPQQELQRFDIVHQDFVGRGAKAPWTAVAGLPNRPDTFSNSIELHREISSAAALSDRAVGAVIFRHQPTPIRVCEWLSTLPINHQPLPAPPAANARLYLGGPWDARNAIAMRRMEAWVAKHGADPLRYGEVVDGDQDLILYFMRMLTFQEGWTVGLRDIRELIAKNGGRSPYGRAWIFWSRQPPETVLAQALEADFPMLCLGTPSKTGRCDFMKPDGAILEGLKIAQLVVNPKDTLEALYEYPEVKSPSYGYDKAMIHPDQFLLKVSARNPRERAWAAELSALRTGDGLKGVSSRRPETSSVPSFRWDENNGDAWAEGVGSKDGFLDADPRAAGAASVDGALRAMIAAGGRPTGGMASLWVTRPTGEPADEAKLRASCLLAMEGAVSYLRDFDMAVGTFDTGGLTFPKQKLEFHVRARNTVSAKMPVLVPGFRMTGEVLYVVGPKPAFMDAGSRILSHVRVMSNHCFKVNSSVQLELYSLVHELLLSGRITCIRPVGEGGVVQTLGEMALWGNMGAQIRPNLAVMELFSAAPGRFVVGLIPQETKSFEARVRGEWLTVLGASGGEKLMGLSLASFFEERVKETES